MTDLYDMFENGGDSTTPEDNEVDMDALDFAQAVGLAESLMDTGPEDFTNVEALFDNDEEAHQEAERVSLKDRNTKQNIPNFEKMVMGKCGLL